MDDRLKKDVKVVSLSLDPVKKAFNVTCAKNLVTSSEIVLRKKNMDKFNDDDDENSLIVVQYYEDALIVFEGINTLFHDNWILDCTYMF